MVSRLFMGPPIVQRQASRACATRLFHRWAGKAAHAARSAGAASGVSADRERARTPWTSRSG